jgi:hypothetical protein
MRPAKAINLDKKFAAVSRKLANVKFELLTSNPKVVKGQKKGVWTLILHLAPAKLSGYEVCPKRTVGCTEACLNIAGRGGIALGGILTHLELMQGIRTNAVQVARIRRTKMYFEQRDLFMATLRRDISKAVKLARKYGIVLAIRLNGTSDIRWELSGIFGEYPSVQFYDYTKIANRRVAHIANYHVTFSLADGNATEAETARANGINVAAVYRNKSTVAAMRSLDSTIIDGDETDLRFLDGKFDRGRIVALYAKGAAKKDASGFVQDFYL